MSSWKPHTWHNGWSTGYVGTRKFEEEELSSDKKEREQNKQYYKSISRLKLRNRLDKEILDEQLKCHLFELEQRRELEKITLQKKKDEEHKHQHQEEEHKRLLGKQSFKAYTDKMKRLKDSWMQGGISEDEDSKLINLEEEEDRMRNFNGWE